MSRGLGGTGYSEILGLFVALVGEAKSGGIAGTPCSATLALAQLSSCALIHI